MFIIILGIGYVAAVIVSTILWVVRGNADTEEASLEELAPDLFDPPTGKSSPTP